MLGKLNIFKRKKKKVDKGTLEYFTDKLSYLFNVLVMSYYTSMLKWYEIIIVVVCGAFLGIGVGIVIYQAYVRPPATIIIPLNETHIIRVRP